MTRQLWAMALGLMFLAFSAGMAQAQTDSRVNRWVASNLPQGVTVQSATAVQLSTAVKAAIQTHPNQAKANVAYVSANFSNTSGVVNSPQ